MFKWCCVTDDTSTCVFCAYWKVSTVTITPLPGSRPSPTPTPTPSSTSTTSSTTRTSSTTVAAGVSDGMPSTRNTELQPDQLCARWRRVGDDRSNVTKIVGVRKVESLRYAIMRCYSSETTGRWEGMNIQYLHAESCTSNFLATDHVCVEGFIGSK